VKVNRIALNMPCGLPLQARVASLKFIAALIGDHSTRISENSGFSTRFLAQKVIQI
jgi:hypothetical protein